MASNRQLSATLGLALPMIEAELKKRDRRIRSLYSACAVLVAICLSLVLALISGNLRFQAERAEAASHIAVLEAELDRYQIELEEALASSDGTRGGGTQWSIASRR